MRRQAGGVHEDLAGLEDLLLELEEVVEEALDLLDGQVDEHAGDLGSEVLTDELLDVLVDELSDELLEVRVLRKCGCSDTKGESLLVLGHRYQR